jgi:hypothetical protein
VAPLLPKLRGQFAEFLNEHSHMGLRILTPPTCVGLRYGHVTTSRPRIFLASGVIDFSGYRLRPAP